MRAAAADLAELARTFASIVERIAERDGTVGAGSPGEAEHTGGGWVDQHHSDLSVRQHCRAVRRRRAEGKGGAEIHGRRYLLTREALWEEMTRAPKPGLRKCGALITDPRDGSPGNGGPASPTPSRHASVAEATAAKLRLIRARGK